MEPSLLDSDFSEQPITTPSNIGLLYASYGIGGGVLALGTIIFLAYLASQEEMLLMIGFYFVLISIGICLISLLLAIAWYINNFRYKVKPLRKFLQALFLNLVNIPACFLYLWVALEMNPFF